MKEFGSYLPLDIRPGNEYYNGRRVLRLSCARAGILLALRLCACRCVLLPAYYCPEVSAYLTASGIQCKSYALDRDLLPVLPEQLPEATALLIVNFFGLMPAGRLRSFAEEYPNVIVDNAQAFFALPIPGTYSIYSPRKFFGVPDGCYLIAPEIPHAVPDLPPLVSAENSVFLFSRLEQGCEAGYTARQKNEERFGSARLWGMSELARRLLQGIDYDFVRRRRQENYTLFCSMYRDINLIGPDLFAAPDDGAVPMIYPLVLQDRDADAFLRSHGVFVGRLWAGTACRPGAGCTGRMLSKYMLPLPIDQNMTRADISAVHEVIRQRL